MTYCLFFRLRFFALACCLAARVWPLVSLACGLFPRVFRWRGSLAWGRVARARVRAGTQKSAILSVWSVSAFRARASRAALVAVISGAARGPPRSLRVGQRPVVRDRSPSRVSIWVEEACVSIWMARVRYPT